VRPMGRPAHGVGGIRLGSDQRVIALLILTGGAVLTVTENGYGKRTAIEEYPRHGRGGQGVVAIQTSERNGAVVGAELVEPGDEIMLISSAGTLVRTRVDEIPLLSRNTQGVRVIRLGKNERLVGLERIESIDEVAAEADDDVPPSDGHERPAPS